MSLMRGRLRTTSENVFVSMDVGGVTDIEAAFSAVSAAVERTPEGMPGCPLCIIILMNRVLPEHPPRPPRRGFIVPGDHREPNDVDAYLGMFLHHFMLHRTGAVNAAHSDR